MDCFVSNCSLPFKHKHSINIERPGFDMVVVTGKTLEEMVKKGYYVHCVEVPKQIEEKEKDQSAKLETVS